MDVPPARAKNENAGADIAAYGKDAEVAAYWQTPVKPFHLDFFSRPQMIWISLAMPLFCGGIMT
jgi:hypothetical protein